MYIKSSDGKFGVISIRMVISIFVDQHAYRRIGIHEQLQSIISSLLIYINSYIRDVPRLIQQWSTIEINKYK